MLAERIAAEAAAPTTPVLGQQQIEECARVLFPILTGGRVVTPAPLQFAF